MNRNSFAIALAFCQALTFSAAAVLFAQEPPPPAEPQSQTPAAGAPRPGITPPSQDPQPYDKVITKDAKSKKGIFTVHQIKDKYYYEIPKSEFGKQFLWNTQISKTVQGIGYGGDELTERVVHWELNGNKGFLRDNNFAVTAIAQAVKAANHSTIILS